jgi:hypothetical protein
MIERRLRKDEDDSQLWIKIILMRQKKWGKIVSTT